MGKKKQRQKIAAIITVIIAYLLFTTVIITYTRSKTHTVVSSSEPTNTITQFNAQLFYTGLQQSQETPELQNKIIKGSIIPHHTLASSIITNNLRALTAPNPSEIILLGPNHQEVGDKPFLTSDRDWQTPAGILQANKPFITILQQLPNFATNHTALIDDQSIAALIPYIKHFLPNTKITPILISNTRTTAQHIDALVLQLATSNATIIASTDFSHDQGEQLAARYDQQTLTLINQRDYTNLMLLTSKHTDAAKTLTLFLKLMDTKQVTQSFTLQHATSNTFLRQNNTTVTTYFSIAYY